MEPIDPSDDVVHALVSEITACRPDFDHSGTVAVPDIFVFLAALFAQ